MVPKAGLEPARISTVDFESTAPTDFATSALKRYAENVVDYTCRTPPCKRQLARTSLSAEIFSIAYRDVGNDSNLLIVFYVQIMPDDFVMQLHRF